MASKKKDFLPEGLRVRLALYVNLRPCAGIEAFAKIMENETKLESGNKFGYVLLPLEIALRDDPLDYILRAKATIDRKKLSFEAVCSFAIGLFIPKLFGIKLCTDMEVSLHLIKDTLPLSNVIPNADDTDSLWGFSSMNAKYIRHLLKSSRFDRYAILLSVALVWASAALLTAAGAYKNRSLSTQFSCRVDRSGLIGGASCLQVDLLQHQDMGLPRMCHLLFSVAVLPGCYVSRWLVGYSKWFNRISVINNSVE